MSSKINKNKIKLVNNLILPDYVFKMTQVLKSERMNIKWKQVDKNLHLQIKLLIHLFKKSRQNKMQIK